MLVAFCTGLGLLDEALLRIPFDFATGFCAGFGFGTVFGVVF